MEYHSAPKLNELSSHKKAFTLNVHYLKKGSQYEKTTLFVILNTQDPGKGKIMETVKKVTDELGI